MYCAVKPVINDLLMHRQYFPSSLRTYRSSKWEKCLTIVAQCRMNLVRELKRYFLMQLKGHNRTKVFMKSHLRPFINNVGNWEGGKSKIGQNCRRVVPKKLPTWGRGVSKIQKKCRRRLWMVPLYFH